MPFNVVFKYPLKLIMLPQRIAMPEGAEIVSAAMQHGDVMLWAKVSVPSVRDNEAPSKMQVERRFIVAGTGHNLPEGKLGFIATVMDDPYVWHVFEMLL